MKIAFESELMENQKHAKMLPPDGVFEVLQSPHGASLFFSISDSHNTFYLTREVTKTSTGWKRNGIIVSRIRPAIWRGPSGSTRPSTHPSTALPSLLRDATSFVKSPAFAPSTTLTRPGPAVVWTAIPFDATPAPSSLSIADVFLMNIPGQGEIIFVDIERNPGDPLRLLDRYYITPGASPRWNPHKLGFPAAGSIPSCLGQNTSDLLRHLYVRHDRQRTRIAVYPQYNY